MLYYDRVDVSEGIDVNKTSKSIECNRVHMSAMGVMIYH